METVKRIGIYNNKGGVAKTTSVINLAYSLHKNDKKVLIVDCDTQENCFSFFLANQSMGDILTTAYENISHTTWQRYCNIEESNFECYDYIIFDMPPTMSEEVKTMIKHCNVIFVPTMLGEFEIAGLKNVTDEIHKQGAKLGGVFVTMYQPQNDAEIIKEFRMVLQSRLMQTVIPYSKTVRESQKEGLPIEEYFVTKGVPRNKNSWKIVSAYEALAQEVMRGA